MVLAHEDAVCRTANVVATLGYPCEDCCRWNQTCLELKRENQTFSKHTAGDGGASGEASAFEGDGTACGASADQSAMSEQHGVGWVPSQTQRPSGVGASPFQRRINRSLVATSHYSSRA